MYFLQDKYLRWRDQLFILFRQIMLVEQLNLRRLETTIGKSRKDTVSPIPMIPVRTHKSPNLISLIYGRQNT